MWPGEHTDGLNPIKAMGVIDTPTRKNLIGTTVGHPEGTPSREELKYYNPSLKESTLSTNLSKLEETDIIESAGSPHGINKGDSYRFYRLTDDARELFDRNKIFGESEYKNLFEQIEKDEDIIAAEQAPRPAFK